MIYLVLALISYLDFKQRIISDWVTIPFMATGIILNGSIAVIGILVGILSIHTLNYLNITHWGGGDCKLMGAIGGFVGFKIVFVIVLSLIITKIFRKFFKNYKPLPLAPFISCVSLIFI